MKILHVITSLKVGGAEKLLVDILPILNSTGHKADVLLFDGVNTPFKQMLLNKGINVYHLSIGGSVYNLKNIFKLIPYLRKYDIVHTHNTAAQLLVAIAKVLCSVVLCTTEHTTSNRRRNWKWYVPIDRFMYRRYSHVICISDKTEENLRNHIGDVGVDISTIHNGVNTLKYMAALPNESLKRDTRKTILCMVAGFRPQKDQDTIIRSFRYLDKNKYELWLVGDGERRNELQSLVDSEGVTDSVVFWGIRTDIPEILKTSDIIIMSSHYEGFGLAAVEGMAAGKPVIASDVDGLSQVVDKAGLVFPKGNSKALASCVEYISSNQIVYADYANKSVERAKTFDISYMVNEYIEIYKKICRKNRN